MNLLYFSNVPFFNFKNNWQDFTDQKIYYLLPSKNLTLHIQKRNSFLIFFSHFKNGSMRAKN